MSSPSGLLRRSRHASPRATPARSICRPARIPTEHATTCRLGRDRALPLRGGSVRSGSGRSRRHGRRSARRGAARLWVFVIGVSVDPVWGPRHSGALQHSGGTPATRSGRAPWPLSHVQVVDVAVHPDHQRQGVLPTMLERVMQYLANLPTSTTVSLFGDVDWLDQKLEFATPTTSTGMFLVDWPADPAEKPYRRCGRSPTHRHRSAPPLLRNLRRRAAKAPMIAPTACMMKLPASSGPTA